MEESRSFRDIALAIALAIALEIALALAADGGGIPLFSRYCVSDSVSDSLSDSIGISHRSVLGELICRFCAVVSLHHHICSKRERERESLNELKSPQKSGATTF